MHFIVSNVCSCGVNGGYVDVDALSLVKFHLLASEPSRRACEHQTRRCTWKQANLRLLGCREFSQSTVMCWRMPPPSFVDMEVDQR